MTKKWRCYGNAESIPMPSSKPHEEPALVSAFLHEKKKKKTNSKCDGVRVHVRKNVEEKR
jgi:hypothetical protein